MNAYTRCCDCGRKRLIPIGQLDSACMTCGCEIKDVQIGSEPEWWKDESSVKTDQESK